MKHTIYFGSIFQEVHGLCGPCNGGKDDFEVVPSELGSVLLCLRLIKKTFLTSCIDLSHEQGWQKTSRDVTLENEIFATAVRQDLQKPDRVLRNQYGPCHCKETKKQSLQQSVHDFATCTSSPNTGGKTTRDAVVRNKQVQRTLFYGMTEYLEPRAISYTECSAHTFIVRAAKSRKEHMRSKLELCSSVHFLCFFVFRTSLSIRQHFAPHFIFSMNEM